MSSSTAAPSARTTLLDDLDFELEGAGGWTGGLQGASGTLWRRLLQAAEKCRSWCRRPHHHHSECHIDRKTSDYSWIDDSIRVLSNTNYLPQFLRSTFTQLESTVTISLP